MRPPAAVQPGLHSPAADVQGVPGKPGHMERVHHRGGLREFFGGGSLEAGEPIHRHDLHPVSSGLGLLGEPRLERLLRTALDHCRQPAGTSARGDGGQVNDDGDVRVPAADVALHVLVDADNRHMVEAAGLVD